MRARRLIFFSVVNPVIETGGLFGESKINILNRIPEKFLPITVFIPKHEKELAAILKKLKLAGIVFPLIAKPDIGERGFLVEILKTENELAHYINRIKANFIIQELIMLPTELSVLYYRMPSEKKGKITSICIKKNLSVIGDGTSNIETLMSIKPRAILQLERFKKNHPELLKNIPTKGQEVEIEPIGNHSRGTTFLNGNDFIDKELTHVFDEVCFQMEDIFYGRFDLKCESIEGIKEGKGFKVMEFNGVGSEPAHIYDPEYPKIKAYKDLYQHCKILYKISVEQMNKGVKAMSIKEIVQSYKVYKNYLKNAMS